MKTTTVLTGCIDELKKNYWRLFRGMISLYPSALSIFQKGETIFFLSYKGNVLTCSTCQAQL